MVQYYLTIAQQLKITAHIIIYCTTQNITEKHICLIYIRFINLKEIMTRITIYINDD